MPLENRRRAAIFSRSRKLDIDNELLHEMIFKNFGVDSIKKLTAKQEYSFLDLLNRLSDNGEGAQRRHARAYHGRKNYDKSGDVAHMIGPSDLKRLRKAAALRGWSEKTLQEFSRRQCKQLTPRTMAEFNKVWWGAAFDESAGRAVQKGSGLTWLYVPGPAFRFAPESAESTLASRSRWAGDTPVWATSSGTALPRPSSWRGWKTRGWIERLSGTISQPSLAASTAASSISSQPAFRASHGARRASSRGRKTSAGSGRISPAPFALLDRDSCSWRTSAASLLEADLPRFSGVWPVSGSMRNGRCYERRTWAPRISGRGSSSWPTARAEDSESCGNHSGATDSLTGATKDWPTPKVATGKYTRDDGKRGNERPTLVGEAENWQTPAADSFRSRGGDRKDEAGLDRQARLWPTPRSISGGAESGNRKQDLGRKGSGGGDLQAEALNWPTPDASVANDGETVGSYRARQTSREEKFGREAKIGEPLAVACRTFRPADLIGTLGAKCSTPTRSGIRLRAIAGSGGLHSKRASRILARLTSPDSFRVGRLNPMFAEWLMGLPHSVGSAHSCIGWTGFAPVETASYLCRQRQLLSRLCGGLAGKAA